MASNVYYLTGLYTCAQIRKNTQGGGPSEIPAVWDAAAGVIAFSPSPEQAQSLFEDSLRQQPEGDEHPLEVTIRKIYVAPIGGQLLTESGNVPLNWAQILETMIVDLESTPVDDFEQGYWVDVEQVVPSANISFSVGTLESNVPEDVRSGLNWSADKQFFFLLKVLPIPPPPSPPVYEGEDIESELPEEPGPGEIDEANVIFPETVAVIQARNSVAAAWLWRRYAANTQWNNNAIRITELGGTVGEPE